MDYDAFKSAFVFAVQESDLRLLSVRAPSKEALDLQSMERTVEVFVEPLSRDSGPFHVSASVSYVWDSLATARTATTEEDLLSELHGRAGARRAKTDRPALRVDVSLRASLMTGKEIPLPKREAWIAWSREAITRLQRIERVIPKRQLRRGSGGLPEILGWQGEPELRVLCDADGALRLQGIEANAFQILELPRRWDDPDRKPDPRPDASLRTLFKRLKAAMFAWGEVMDHLVPRPR